VQLRLSTQGHFIHVELPCGRVKKMEPGCSRWCPVAQDKRQWVHIEMQAILCKEKKNFYWGDG